MSWAWALVQLRQINLTQSFRVLEENRILPYNIIKYIYKCSMALPSQLPYANSILKVHVFFLSQSVSFRFWFL